MTTNEPRAAWQAPPVATTTEARRNWFCPFCGKIVYGTDAELAVDHRHDMQAPPRPDAATFERAVERFEKATAIYYGNADWLAGGEKDAAKAALLEFAPSPGAARIKEECSRLLNEARATLSHLRLPAGSDQETQKGLQDVKEQLACVQAALTNGGTHE